MFDAFAKIGYGIGIKKGNEERQILALTISFVIMSIELIDFFSSLIDKNWSLLLNCSFWVDDWCCKEKYPATNLVLGHLVGFPTDVIIW